MDKPEISQEAKPAKLYEIGYLLTPLLPSEQAAEVADTLFVSEIESAGGVVTSQLVPQMRPLAYPVAQSINSKISRFRDAYFGALRFELSSDEVVALKEKINKEEKVIRFLLVGLPKSASRTIENYSRSSAMARRELNEVETPVFVPEELISEADKPEMTTEEIDKEIEDLLVEKQA